MKNNNYLHINHIIERIQRDGIAQYGFNEEEIKEWTYDALRKIKTKHTTKYSVTPLEVKDYAAKIPNNIYEIEGVYNSKDEELMTPIYSGQLKENNYIIENNYIYVAFETGVVYIAHTDIITDENGDPMIPDDIYYISAIEAYIKYKIGERAVLNNKLPAAFFQRLEQEWLFALPAVKGNNNMSIMKDQKKFRSISNRFIH